MKTCKNCVAYIDELRKCSLDYKIEHIGTGKFFTGNLCDEIMVPTPTSKCPKPLTFKKYNILLHEKR